jgi:hypothetical protein
LRNIKVICRHAALTPCRYNILDLDL